MLSATRRSKEAPRGAPEAMAAAAPPARAPAYTYTSLAQALQLPPGGCNLYGVVKECTQPKPTKGTDWMMTLTLVDDSLGSGEAVEVNIFGGGAKLPPVRQVGDICRLHRAKAGRWEGRPQFLGMLNRGLAYALFSAAEGATDEPYHHSGETFTFDDSDRAQLPRLRALSRRLRSQPVIDERDLGQYARTISEIRHGAAFYDLVCYVPHVSWPSSPAAGLPVIWAWDGTDAFPYDPTFTHISDQGWPGDTLPLRQTFPLAAACAALPRVMPGMRGPFRSAATLGGVPPIGTFLPVVLHPYAAVMFTQGSLNLAGGWHKLRNIGVMVADGQLQGVFSQHSKVATAAPPIATTSSAEVRATGDEGINLWFARTKAGKEAASLSRVVHPAASGVPFSTLREVRAAPPPAKFKCLVRVKSVRPAEAHKFTGPAAKFASEQAAAARLAGDPAVRLPSIHSWPHGPTGAAPGAAVLAVLLHIEDATDEAVVVCTGDDAATFFGGAASPPVLMDGPEHPTAMALQAQVERMTQLQDTGKGGEKRFPWLIVALESYVDATQARGALGVEALQDMRSVKRLRLCDTALKM